MYDNFVKTPDEAICHLFLHCCMKDGNLNDAEIDNLADKFVALNMHRDLNFKEQTDRYRSYSKNITDETAYLQFLVRKINPVNNLALYSACVELILSDADLDLAEDKLLSNIARVLQIDFSEQRTIQKLMIQRRVVETEKIL
jgi:uncharacterized tellurite resistance protein B-like protein